VNLLTLLTVHPTCCAQALALSPHPRTSQITHVHGRAQASRGVGREFVRILAADGWRLICLDRDDVELDATIAEVSAETLVAGLKSGDIL
jgi:short-subunit dehydrogenase